MEHLTLCNLSHNDIESLPSDFVDRFGIPNETSGICSQMIGCQMILEENPFLITNNDDNMNEGRN